MKFLLFSYSESHIGPSFAAALTAFLQERPELGAADSLQILHKHVEGDFTELVIGYTESLPQMMALDANLRTQTAPSPPPRRSMRHRPEPVVVPHPTPNSLQPVFAPLGGTLQPEKQSFAPFPMEKAPVDGSYVTLLADAKGTPGFQYVSALCCYDPGMPGSWRTREGDAFVPKYGQPVGWLPGPSFSE